MRDDTWLFQKLDELWDGHFSDIPQNNDVVIKFGRKASQRLGSIKQESVRMAGTPGAGSLNTGCGTDCDSSKNRKTAIIINGLFRDPAIPEYVVTAVIAHELCHYAHGFSSPLEQRHPHPHYGGVVAKELKERGFEKELKLQKKWLKEKWPEYLKEKMPVKPRRRRKKRVVIRWI